ncbi:Uncharacterised protein [Mycobacteroides abscessus subsp. abscessus]|nr:Uncharacterised protein [Mycobacteroides abscessus subsp. abscessus]
MRKVPRCHRADDTARLTYDGASRRFTERGSRPEIGCPRVVFGKVGDIAQTVDRRLQMAAMGERHGRADLGDGDGAQVLDLVIQRVAQLPQAVHPQRRVAGPVGVVECGTGGGDGTVHVAGVGIRRVPQRLLGGRVDRRELAAATGHQLPIDQQGGAHVMTSPSRVSASRQAARMSAYSVGPPKKKLSWFSRSLGCPSRL